MRTFQTACHGFQYGGTVFVHEGDQIRDAEEVDGARELLRREGDADQCGVAAVAAAVDVVGHPLSDGPVYSVDEIVVHPAHSRLAALTNALPRPVEPRKLTLRTRSHGGRATDASRTAPRCHAPMVRRGRARASAR